MAHEQAREVGRVAVDRTRSGQNGGSIGLVLLIAVVLVGAGVALMMIGRTHAEPYILALLAVLAMVGVFLLFALAAGMLRVPGKDAASPLIKSLVDSGINAILVTDAAGRVVYANAAYLKLVEANGTDDVRPVERVFVGDPGVSEAVFRLLKAAREGRRLQEEVRVETLHGETGRWLRMRVRPLGEGKREAKLTVWSIADVTRELERQENVFQELQHAVDYLDHAPAGFFSVDAAGNISYLNATLAEWLEQDLAEVGSGGLKLRDIIAGEGGALVTTLSAAPGEVKTELFDIDLKTKGGRNVPARLYHKVAFGADGTPGSSRTLVINRAGDHGSDPLRAAEVRFMRFFQNTPMAIATVDKQGTIVRSNALFARLFNPVLKGEGSGGRSILAVVGERDRSGLEAAIKRAADKQGEIDPVDATLEGLGDRSARFYVTAVEEQDQEAAIVYGIETTAQKDLENKFTQAQKMELVGQLAGGIAHDFNNVLGAIMMASDFLVNAHKPTDPSFQDIIQIRQNANRAAAMVRHLLAFSRKQTLRPQVIDLGDVVYDLTMLMRRLIGERITLNVVPQRDLWPVKADLAQFEQVLVNLVVNARDAMTEGGKLTLRTANVGAGRERQVPVQGHADRRVRPGRGPGHRHRHSGRHHRQDLRPVLHHQGRRQGHRARAVDRLRHHQADRRLRLCRVAPWARYGKSRHDLPHLHPALHPGRRRHTAAAAAGDDGAGDRRRAHRRRRRDEDRRRPDRAGRHPAGRGRRRAARTERAWAHVTRLYGHRGRQRRRGDGDAGAAGRQGRSRGVRRGDAGDGRADAAQGAAQEESRDQDHLRLRLCRGGVPEEPARSRCLQFPGQALHAQATGRQGEGDHGEGVMRDRQAAMDDQTKQTDERSAARKLEDRERTVTNIVLLLIFAALVGIGVWLSNAMLDARRADECISSGRRNCNPIEVPPR